jgi:hypothetical protein
MAALPAVSAATPPAIKAAFRSVALFALPRIAAKEEVALSRSASGSLFVRGSLMTLLVVLPDERPL